MDNHLAATRVALMAPSKAVPTVASRARLKADTTVYQSAVRRVVPRAGMMAAWKACH